MRALVPEFGESPPAGPLAALLQSLLAGGMQRAWQKTGYSMEKAIGWEKNAG